MNNKKVKKNFLYMVLASFAISIFTLLLTTDPYPGLLFLISASLAQVAIYTGVSFFLSSVPAFIYKWIKKQWWNGFYIMIWIVWGVIVISANGGQLMHLYE